MSIVIVEVQHVFYAADKTISSFVLIKVIPLMKMWMEGDDLHDDFLPPTTHTERGQCCGYSKRPRNKKKPLFLINIAMATCE